SRSRLPNDCCCSPLPRPGVPSTHTARTDITTACRFVALAAGRTGLAGEGGVLPVHRHAHPLRLGGDKGGELVEGPAGDQAVVGEGLRRVGLTACACRALVDASELLQADDAPALRLGMRDASVGELLVGVAHPAGLPGLLQRFAAGVDLAAFRTLRS